MAGMLMEDIFEVKNKDPDGKKFDKVSRIIATSQHQELDMVLDVNTDIYPVYIGDRLTVALAATLELGGKMDSGRYDPLLGTAEKPSLMDKYDYVMHGKVFRTKAQSSTKTDVYISFGGLLMKLSGEPRVLYDVAYTDSGLYLLIRQ
eukprot:gb/GECH01009381.1/.p1 GENE.gb/GECH01009381.1/~~gb/GECH01009381.1/.p1  ORF type:complete len:147 (+),score=27.39 gb/GECH01009381.1/:1-441(+)